jgi:hypothetical protein
VKQVTDKKWGASIRLSVVLGLLFVACLLWSNTCFAVSSSWNYYTLVQGNGVVLKSNPDKSGQLCFLQIKEVENPSTKYKDCNHYISCLGTFPNPVLSLNDSTLLSSPPQKRYLLFHALKLDC